ncbi:sensor histidine kinase [Sphingobacterium bovistauri]|uniref:histidine kinase n=1 Tax=Sphingobacterium bovistauri TaxID=2781959 RepID=A0ABS7Z5S2_9SPHI|nr:HAMP domain-containing sensor histidine kinase [Sphingobacterium bovistauri]MCA5005551.1 HAMP domain-containing histidine kinase [Sphingobacterium bovistauri]
MDDQNLIYLLIVGIVVSKAIIAVLIYLLVKKNRALKLEKQKLVATNATLALQRDQIIIYNQELKSSEEFKTKVISIASHDLRVPIISMEMLLNFDDAILLSKDDLHQIFSTISSQLSISRKMIDEILLWTDSQLRHNIENKESFNLSEQIKLILPVFNADIQANKINVINNIQDSYLLYMSKDIFSFIIRNVLSNAVKYCKGMGTVVIGFSKNDTNELCLYVQNECDELSMEDLENLNTKYSWSYKKKNNNRGAGLGISLCKDLFMRIGGRLKFENIKAIGLKVTLYFPTAVENMGHTDSLIINKISTLQEQTID